MASSCLDLAERWGGGEVASIDGRRFVVPRRTIHAAYNRRYFDRRRGVTLLGTTADHYAGLHMIVITGTEPDAPYILDGLLDPQTSVRPHEIMTDTAGYRHHLRPLPPPRLPLQPAAGRLRRRPILAHQTNRLRGA